MQHSKFVSAIGRTEALANAYLCFLVSAFEKKCWGSWIRRNLKKTLFKDSKNKKYLFLFRKEMPCIISYFCFSHNFRTCFYDTDHLSTYVCIFFSFFCCSLKSVSYRRNIERILNLSYLCKWQKFHEMNKKRNLGYQSMTNM